MPKCHPSICSLSRNPDSTDQATFFQSSAIKIWRAFVHCSLRFLFLADWTEIRRALLLLYRSLPNLCLPIGSLWDAFLLAKDLKSGYLSYHSLRLVSVQLHIHIYICYMSNNHIVFLFLLFFFLLLPSPIWWNVPQTNLKRRTSNIFVDWFLLIK